MCRECVGWGRREGFCGEGLFNAHSAHTTVTVTVTVTTVVISVGVLINAYVVLADVGGAPCLNVAVAAVCMYRGMGQMRL